ncbi:AraC family transcriptional regulator [Neopusillimonas maritima]|uniref:HTH araC/xylS-type domain-containing protein n=1 Tax=Neopusillimonas maritima TaxID=2026239 RepID=A0ABX9MSI6_9BURK|nr:AraC family transcriptional regulator [Neopusillimonas maritima]RII81819.1 hypothetical protein CJO09_14635 [Neopusillimonas maritima]
MQLKHKLVDQISGQYVPTTEASTDQVDPEHRIAYWEEHNAVELIGLTCRELHGVALQAYERNYDLGRVRLSDIRGSSHEIERGPSMVRRLPKNALFASVLVDGRGYFLQNGQKVWLEPGDAVLYATDQPYLFGFSKPMRQILVDLDLQTAQCKGWPRLHGPVLVGQNRRLDRYDMMSFVSILTKFVQLPVQSQANCVAASVQSLIGRAVGTTVSRGRDSTAQLRYARAKAFISERAANPGFDREQLAAFMGMSLRTLERLFVQFGSTLTEAVWQQRLEKARDLLTMPSTQTLPIAEIAGRSGFVSQAHFSTAFRRFYGVSPRQFREQCLVVK